MWGVLIGVALCSCTIGPRPQQIGQIGSVMGQVYVGRAESAHPEALTQPHPLFAQDVIESQPQSRARLSLSHARLVLGPDSRLTFYEQSEEGHTTIALDRGTVRIEAGTNADELWTVEILAAGSSVVTQHGEVTVWIADGPDEHAPTEPGLEAIQAVGVINHGTQGEVIFQAAGRRVFVRPGFLSATAPEHPPIPPVAIEAAQSFVTHTVQATDLDLSRVTATAVNPAPWLAAKRMTETVAQRICKEQKEKASRMKPSTDPSKTRFTHCL